MVAGVNRTTHIGNLTDDPKFSRGESAEQDRMEFSLAINEGGRGRDGNEPPPTYLDFVFWGKSAESYSQNLSKGRAVYVEGRIEVRSWEDRETQARRKAWRIKAYTIRYLDSNRDSRDSRDDRDDRPRRDDRRPRRDDRDDRSVRREEPPRDRDTSFDDLPF